MAVCCGGLISSCQRDELYYPNANKFSVKVLIEYDLPSDIEPVSPPNTIYLGIYNADNNEFIRKEVIEEVNVYQDIDLEKGRYHFVVYNEPYVNGELVTANSVYYAGVNNWEMLSVIGKNYSAASGGGNSSRSTVWIEDLVMSDRKMFFEVTRDTTLSFHPKLVFPQVNITLRVKNYTGWTFRRVNGNRPFIDGLAASYQLGSGIYSDNLATMYLDFKNTSAAVEEVTTFRSSSFMIGFPKGDIPLPNLQSNHTFFIRFDYATSTGVEILPIFINLQNGEGAKEVVSYYTQAGNFRLLDGKKYPYDIWDLDVLVELEERTPVGDGLDAGLDDWENENVPLNMSSKANNNSDKMKLYFKNR